jgi:hypothetical protein
MLSTGRMLATFQESQEKQACHSLADGGGAVDFFKTKLPSGRDAPVLNYRSKTVKPPIFEQNRFPKHINGLGWPKMMVFEGFLPHRMPFQADFRAVLTPPAGCAKAGTMPRRPARYSSRDEPAAQAAQAAGHAVGGCPR